jgi:hypothetical protein
MDVKSLKKITQKIILKQLMKHSILRSELVSHWQLRNRAHELFFTVVCKDVPFSVKVDMWQYFLDIQKSVFEAMPSERTERLMIERLGIEFDKLPTKSKEVEAVCVFCYKENITKEELCVNCLRDLSKAEPLFLCHECGKLWRHTCCVKTASSIISTSNSPEEVSNTLCKNLKPLSWSKYHTRWNVQDERQQKYYKMKFVKYGYKNYDTVCRRQMCSRFTSSSGSAHLSTDNSRKGESH